MWRHGWALAALLSALALQLAAHGAAAEAVETGGSAEGAGVP